MSVIRLVEVLIILAYKLFYIRFYILRINTVQPIDETSLNIIRVFGAKKYEWFRYVTINFL